MFLLLVVLVLIAFAYTYTGANRISSAQAVDMIASGDIQEVVDVRTRAEYGAGHYPGAVNIPVTEINERTTTGLPTSGILVYCNTGQRARFAAERLTAMGFRDVYYIAGTYENISV